jgi:hypothetical protein
MWELIKRAGLTRQEMSPVLGASYPTLKRWDAGEREPNIHLRDGVMRRLDMLQRAMEAGELPLDRHTERGNLPARVAVIKSIMERYIT